MKRRLISLAAVAVGVAACAPRLAVVPAVGAAPATILWAGSNPVTYTAKVVGNYENYNELFVGDIGRSLRDGVELVRLDMRNSGATCTGAMRHADDWPNELPDPLGVCLSRIANGAVKCTDGRELTLSWRATECRTAHGSGFDRDGGTVTFIIGLDDRKTEAQAAMLANQLSPYPPLPYVKPR
jgi:hypothetical protein